MKLISLHATWRNLALATVLFTISSCNFAQSVEKDPQSGLITRGDGLSCDDVYLSDGENIIKRNTFIYGETFYVNFDGIEGFVREGESVFPDMQLTIIGEQGDTALHLDDLYAAYEEGIDLSPLQLYAEVTVANPVQSGETYTLYVDIRDKKGEGSYTATLGFTVNGGQVQLGLSMVVKDADGTVILDEADLFGDTPLNYEDVHLQVASNFILTGSQVTNPLTVTVRIWDKGSSAWIIASTEIVIE